MSSQPNGTAYLPPQPPVTISKPPPPTAIVVPQRSNSLDYLNFEEKRQLIASSLSLSDFLHHGPAAAAAAAAKEAASTVIVGKPLADTLGWDGCLVLVVTLRLRCQGNHRHAPDQWPPACPRAPPEIPL